MKQNYTVIDSHCHVYPEKIAARAVESTDQFYNTHAFGLGTVTDLLTVGTEAGCDGYVIQSVASTPHHVESINRFIATAIAAAEEQGHGGKLTGLGTLHPDHPDLRGAMEAIVGSGLHGVKLHPDIQNFKIDDYRCLKIYELCEQEGLPILMHTGDNRYDNSNPNRLVPVLNIFTGLTIIGAHLGGYSIWNEASEKLAGLDNLYVDCSSSFPFIDKQTALNIIRKYGADKVLYGTDDPMWSPMEEIKTFMSLGLTDDEKRKILSENAKKLFLK